MKYITFILYQRITKDLLHISYFFLKMTNSEQDNCSSHPLALNDILIRFQSIHTDLFQFQASQRVQ